MSHRPAGCLAETDGWLAAPTPHLEHVGQPADLLQRLLVGVLVGVGVRARGLQLVALRVERHPAARDNTTVLLNINPRQYELAEVLQVQADLVKQTDNTHTLPAASA